MPRYISSGVWPAKAECGIFALYALHDPHMDVSPGVTDTRGHGNPVSAKSPAPSWAAEAAR